MERMNQITEALNALTPTAEDALGDSSTFSPRRWKTGWPHHLRRVPPFRDDASASLTRSEVFLFAEDVERSGRDRDQIIDFLGAAFAYGAGQSPKVLTLQQFLRNKSSANKLLQAIRGLEGKTPAEQYAALVETGLPAKFAETIREAIGREPDRPAALQGIEALPKRCAVMAADVAAVKAHIRAHAGAPT